MSHTADGCEISTVSRSRYACSKCTARHLFRSRVLKEEKGFQSSYARPLRSARLEDGCCRASLLGFCARRLFFSLSRRMRMLTVTQRDAHRCVFHNQMTLIYPVFVKIFFNFY